VSITEFQLSSLMRIEGPSLVMPALATSTSTLPQCSSTAAKVSSTCWATVTSHFTQNRSSTGLLEL